MSKTILHRTYLLLMTCLFILAGVFLFSSFSTKPAGNGKLKIVFVNTANGKPIVLRDSVYSNAFGEQYSISKLKYYISHTTIPGSRQLPEADPYHLINAMNDENSYEIELQAGNYDNISFLLGVDSASNCSGAQAGALDPMNDMFWTWNSGYVVFKLEGTSPSSSADLQRIELHIGGYKGEDNVSKLIRLSLKDAYTLHIRENQTTELRIETNLDHFWKGPNDIKISETPLCMATGKLARKVSINFENLFSVTTVK